MISRKTNFFILSLFFLGLSSSAFAVGVDYEGYFRTRANYHYNLDLDRGNNPEIRGYGDFRFRLDPTFYITDKIRVKSSLNMLDAIMGDAPFRGVPYDNPARSNSTLLGNTQGNRVGQTMQSGQMSSGFYGGAYAPDGAIRTADLEPLYLRRAWVEVEFPIGLFKAGRMPYNFGLGILGNSGDGIDQEIGSTRDRITYETAFGNYYIAPGVGWLQEGLLDQPDDDAFEYFFTLGQRTESHHVALYLSWLSQGRAKNSTTNGSSVGTNTSYWVLDFYVQNQFEMVNLQAESVLYAGKFAGKDLLAVNAAARADWIFDRFKLLTEAGLSTGTSDSQIAKNDLRTFSFNREYNISYILFEEPLPGGEGLGGDARETAPHSGAVSNAFYGRLKMGYPLSSFFHPYFNIVVPYAHQKRSEMAGKFYGVEYDIITMWPINDYVTGEVTFAHFIPGRLYNNVSKGHSSFLLRGGMYVKF